MDALVIDNGSYRLRCGLSIPDSPSISTLNLTAAFKRQLPNQKKILFGDEIARTPLSHLTLRSGFEKVTLFIYSFHLIIRPLRM